MLTLRDLRDEIISFLQSNLDDINVQAGKPLETSVIPPSVLVYIEPYTVDTVMNVHQQPVFRKAKVHFLSVVANEATANDSLIKADENLGLIEHLRSDLEAYLFASTKNLDRAYTRIEYPDNWKHFEEYSNNNTLVVMELIFDCCENPRTTS